MATIIAKMAGIIGKSVRFANLRRQEPTPEPTPRQKAGVYEKKAPGFGQKAPGFGRTVDIVGITLMIKALQDK